MQPARVTRPRIARPLRADAPLEYERPSDPILVRRAKDGDRRALPPAQARVLVLKDAVGLSFREVAIVTELPVGTAKCYAHRARGRLRARLSALEPAGVS